MTAAPPDTPKKSRRWLPSLFGGGPRQLILRWGLLIALGVLIYFFAYPQAYAYYHAWQAEKALAKDDCAAARPHLEKCLTVWQTSAQHHFEAARCAWREDDLNAAEIHLRLASRHKWPPQAVDIESVFIRFQYGQSPATEADLTQIFQIGKKDPDTQLLKPALEAVTVGLIRAGRYIDAELPARFMVQEFPDSWRSHWLLGRALEKRLPSGAFESYQRSLEMKPDQPKVHFWLAQFYAENGRPNEAQTHLRQSNRQNADDAETQMVRARIAYRLGEWTAARAALTQALEGGVAQRGKALALRGLVELEDQGSENAVVWLAKAHARAPHDPEVNDALAALATRQGDQEKLKQCQERRKQFQMQAEELEELQRKMVELQRQAKFDPADKRAMAFKIGKAMFEVGQDDVAVPWLKTVLREEPNHPEAHRLLAEYYERIGDLEQARSHRQSGGK